MEVKSQKAGNKWGVSPYMALAIYMLVYFMTQPTNNYFQIYMRSIGLSKTNIGLITGTASAIALIFQPVLGSLADASTSKKRLLAIVTVLSAVAFPAIYFHNAFFWILTFFAIYHCFYSFTSTLSNSVGVEYCQLSGHPFGALRMMGALGFSIMMVFVGYAADKNVNSIFIIYPAVCAVSLLFLLPIPDVKGNNNAKSGYGKVSPFVLLKNKPIVHLILFQTLIGVSAGISNNYFAIYFTDDMHGSSQLFGILSSVSALIEIPFLFFTDKLLQKMGPRRILMLLCTCNAFKNLMFFLARSTTGLFVARCFNFFNVMETVCYALILIRVVQPQLKTTAQTLSSTVQNVASMLFSSYLGGFLADQFGIRVLFGMSAVLVFGIALIFTQFILKGEIDDLDLGEASS